MSELKQQLDVCLANTFAMYLKAHAAHWNVQGPDFKQYHDFFGELYEEVHSAVDLIAELIRTLDELAPGGLAQLKTLTSIADYANETNAMQNVSVLKQANDAVLASLLIAYKLAESEGSLGISNALQDRITAHEKHGWMLRAIQR